MNDPHRPQPSDRELILRLYELDRQDDSQALGTLYAFLATVVGLMSIDGFILLHAHDVPAWAIVLAPLPPLPFIAFGGILSLSATVRGEVIDSFESDLRRRQVTLEARDAMPVPASHTFTGRIWRGPYGLLGLSVAAATLLVGYIAVLVQAYRYASSTEHKLALASLVACSLATAAISLIYMAALFPNRWIAREITRLRQREPGLERAAHGVTGGSTETDDNALRR